MSSSNKNESHQILLVGQQNETSTNTVFLLQLSGYDVSTVRGLDEAINLVSAFCLERDCPAVILIDDQEIGSNHEEMITLLASRCSNSKIFIVERNVQAENCSTTDTRVIAPRHILTGIRKFITEKDSTNENFGRFQNFHSAKF